MKRLLLVGGGHAHVHVLADFARSRPASAEVQMVTPFLRQMYSGMVPGVVAGHYRDDEAAIALAPLAAAAGVSLIESTVTAFDARERAVTLADGRRIAYDLVSFDTGAVMDRDRLPGARQHALFVRPIEHFLRLFESLVDLAARKALDVVVIGGGAAGVELALALEHRLDRLAPPGDARSRVALVLGAPRPLAGHAEGVVVRVERVLARRRITLFPGAVTEVTAGAVVLASGARITCDAPLVATGAEAPAWLAASGLALDDRGFIATGATLQSVSHPEVFAAGDVASRHDAPHPKSGVYAVRAGPPLAANLRAAVAGAALVPHEPQRRTLYLVSCGERRAIASWGGWSAEGRLMWRWKDAIDRRFIRRYSR